MLFCLIVISVTWLLFFSINWVGNQWFQNCHVHQHLSNLQHNDFLWIMCCRFFIIMVHVEYILVSWMQNLPAISYLGVVLVLYFVLCFERMNWNLQCLTNFLCWASFWASHRHLASVAEWLLISAFRWLHQQNLSPGNFFNCQQSVAFVDLCLQLARSKFAWEVKIV